MVTETIPQLLTLMAVANALCVSPHTVRSWVRKGRLRPVRLCRRLLFHPGEVSRFLAEATATSTQTVQEFDRLANVVSVVTLS